MGFDSKTNLQETCSCGASINVKGSWEDVDDIQKEFHEVHKKCKPTSNRKKEK